MMIQFRQDWINDINMMHQEMSRLLDHLSGAKPPLVRFSPTIWQPAIDLYETDDELIVTVELAGVKEQDLQMTVDRNIFTIRGGREKTLPGIKTGVYHQMEISSGLFERSITLPCAVDAENARASYEDVLITVVFPKIKNERTVRLEVITK